ncbi:MAG TPA: carboxypeptidase regulatory-like domain-containing protein, partial [Terracidiphilus sp.]|nr:carboxypeptidase regulatory-like domain-containing protein [Terracidiphilus sp.]
MRRLFAVVCFAVFAAASASSLAQTKVGAKSGSRSIAPEPAAKPQLAAPQVLPVRKVVLYKNGVGYFEHAGSVTGNQRVSIDFTSAQLNDVLQSLTVLDEGGGRIAGVNYNSTTPLAEQLKTLGLGLADYPDTLDIYHSLRGQRVEVTGSGAPFSGRIVNIEFRSKTDKDGQTSQDHYFLIVTSESGAFRTAELTDAVSVRMLDPSMQKLFTSYLEILASTQNQSARHLTLNATGQGQRELRVSYISEVPVWKSTYRIVFPHAGDSAGGTSAIVQGWAVVDNTVGADWDNVQLSLVAGSPQSFIQPLSQPLYTRRAEVPIAAGVETTPQTHEAAESRGVGAIAGVVTDQTGAVIPNAQVTATSQQTNATITKVTSADGGFSVSPLPAGTYTVRVSAQGF